MATLRYMSWNIENLSQKHATRDLMRGENAAAWIARLILDMEADVVGVMELTLGDGASALQTIADAINAIKPETGDPPRAWLACASDRSVSSTSKEARKADKYGILWNSRTTSIKDVRIATGFKIDFADRVPLYWQSKVGASYMSCVLWHATQPKYHKKELTIQNLANLCVAIDKTAGLPKPAIVSGDFNYDTASATTYKPMTDLGFKGLFDGSLSTLKRLKSFMADAANRAKMIAKGDYDEAFLSSAYDNVFVKNLAASDEVKVCIPFVFLQDIMTNPKFQMVTRMQLQTSMERAKIISDHMPLTVLIAPVSADRPEHWSDWGAS